MQLEVITTSTHLGVRYRHTNDGVVSLDWLNHLVDWFGVLSGDPSKGRAFGAQLPPTNALAAVFADGPDGVLLEQGEPLPPPMGVLAFAPRSASCPGRRPT
jgi:hypothetical protein